MITPKEEQIRGDIVKFKCRKRHGLVTLVRLFIICVILMYIIGLLIGRKQRVIQEKVLVNGHPVIVSVSGELGLMTELEVGIEELRHGEHTIRILLVQDDPMIGGYGVSEAQWKKLYHPKEPVKVSISGLESICNENRNDWSLKDLLEIMEGDTHGMISVIGAGAELVSRGTINSLKLELGHDNNELLFYTSDFPVELSISNQYISLNHKMKSLDDKNDGNDAYDGNMLYIYSAENEEDAYKDIQKNMMVLLFLLLMLLNMRLKNRKDIANSSKRKIHKKQKI